MKKKHKNKRKMKRVLLSVKRPAKKPASKLVKKQAEKPAIKPENSPPAQVQKTPQRKPRMKKAAKAALAIIAAGLVLVAVALILEAQHYPWGRLFGTASQEAESIPDPSPIKLDAEDKGVIIVSACPGPVFADTHDACFRVPFIAESDTADTIGFAKSLRRSAAGQRAGHGGVTAGNHIYRSWIT